MAGGDQGFGHGARGHVGAQLAGGHGGLDRAQGALEAGAAERRDHRMAALVHVLGHHAIQQLVGGRLLEAETQSHFQDAAHLRPGVLRLRGHCLQLLAQLLQGADADLQHDLALVLEIHVEGGRRDPDLVGDLADGGAFIARHVEDALGRR